MIEKSNNVKIIYKNEEKFPKLLRDIKNPPEKIYAIGNIELLNKPSIAIVGSRCYSEYGKRMAKRFTTDLVNEGLAIISGLAIGIDSFAHEECINSGGKTVAVLGCGFKHIYPEENENLYKKIINSGGCVITEYSEDVEARKEFFPIRNRLISGLALGTLVIEAHYRSGSTITARYCIEQNRKLFCIPSSIDNKNSSVTNNLIKKGANLVTNVQDILYTLGTIQNKITKEKAKYENKLLSKKELEIYNLLKKKPKTADEIVINTKLLISEVNVLLSGLELEGFIIKLDNNRYKVSNNE